MLSEDSPGHPAPEKAVVPRWTLGLGSHVQTPTTLLADAFVGLHLLLT